MKLADLRAFLDIVEAGSLTAAATRRGVTQPALSRLLRDLETRHRATLLRRTARGVEPTEAGAELARFAAETLAAYDDTRSRIAARVGAVPATLRLSIPLRLERLLIRDLDASLRAAFPETAVHIEEEESLAAAARLTARDLDAGLLYDWPGAGVSPLFMEDLHAVGTPALMGTRESITTKDLAGLPLLLPPVGPFRDLVWGRLGPAGARIVQELQTADGMVAFAAEGVGVAVLPLSNVLREVARGEVVACPLAPALTRRIGVLMAPVLPAPVMRKLQCALREALMPSQAAVGWRTV